jgi:hypothetical protein
VTVPVTSAARPGRCSELSGPPARGGRPWHGMRVRVTARFAQPGSVTVHVQELGSCGPPPAAAAATVTVTVPQACQ